MRDNGAIKTFFFGGHFFLRNDCLVSSHADILPEDMFAMLMPTVVTSSLACDNTPPLPVSLSQIYREFEHTVSNADKEKDLRWWSNNHGVNMAMNWPAFEVGRVVPSCQPVLLGMPLASH